jgi:hypothetical protein
MTNDVSPPTIEAPAIPLPMPAQPARVSTYSPKGRVGRAWAHAWKVLNDHKAAGPGYVDGNDLAAEAADSEGLATATMVGVLTRAATAGLLEKSHVITDGTRGPRKRTQYRIPQS